MSWEHNHYKATCIGCGHEGECIKSSDDWNRSETRYAGFANNDPDATAVGRKRADRRDSSPTCPQCGGTEVRIGPFLKTT
ncbi:hypothetical protein AWB67_06828 [Caballeronia terrestris]|uniref:Uncharacterized protein n=1 Tax=Caballeronia terrestris TaxID=1226301 RepID=A0A158KWN5_9BURK|nr:hypothetical protein AWB81_07447 [Caballeronia arationis]SAL85010.1 hypothetical protein AWB67_06828 [Caballeronia terrestris]